MTEKKHIVLRAAIGLLSGWMFAAMVLSGTGSIKQFYDCGEVYDVIYNEKQSGFIGGIYDVVTGHYQVMEPDAYQQFWLTQDYNAWNYIYIVISRLNQENLEASIEYYLDGVLQHNQPFVFETGKNVIDSSGLKYNSVIIRFQDEVGAELTIEGVQFREKKQFIVWEKFVPIAIGTAICCYILTGLLLRLYRKKNWSLYVFIDVLQDFWIHVAELFGDIGTLFSKKQQSRIRIFLFTGYILVMSMMENLVYLHSKPYYGMTMLAACMILTFASFISIEGKLQKKDWNNPLVLSWFCLCLFAIVSDFIVNKRYQYQGYIMLFAAGFFFFVWNNMKNSNEILKDLIRSGETAFFISLIFNYFCRPARPEITRYTGSFYNPNIEGTFSAAAGILFLIELDQQIAKKKISLDSVLCCAGLLLALDRVVRSDCRTALVAFYLTIICFLLHNIYRMIRKKTFPYILQVLFICLVLFMPLYKANNWLLVNLADYTGTEIKYPRDAVYLTKVEKWVGEDFVYAAESDDMPFDRKRQKLDVLLHSDSFLNAIEFYSSGRTLYYLAYIRQMNLLGHYYHAESWGDYIHPHNALLEIMYRYGIFAGVPYAVMLLYVLWYSFQYARRGHKDDEYKLYPLLISLGTGGIFMFENGEKPFAWMIWFLFYIGMGILFPANNPKSLHLQEIPEESNGRKNEAGNHL